jgi:hypothetical protein
MLSAVTQPEEPVLHRSSTPGYDPIKTLREWGTIAMVGGGGLTVALLVFSGGQPSWPWLVTLLVVVGAGLGLRLEAAIRDRTRS